MKKITKLQEKNTQSFIYGLLDLDISSDTAPIIEDFEENIAKQNLKAIQAIHEWFDAYKGKK